MLDFRVDSFLAVCKHLNYTKAAQELNLSQPAITQHIQYLQNYYQVKFFSRENNQLVLTPEGEMFQKVMTTIRQDLKKVSEDLISLQNERYQLRFGVVPALAEHSLIPQLTEYIKVNQNRNVHLVVDSTNTLLEDLDNGKIHFAIVDTSITKEGYKYLPWDHDRFVCVCSVTHELKKEVNRFKDVLPECLLVHSSAIDPTSTLSNYMKTKGFRIADFDRFIEIDSFTTFKQLLINDCGIAIVPRVTVLNELESGILKEIPLSDFDLQRDYIFIWRRDSVNEHLFLLMYDKLKGLPEGQTEANISGVKYT